MKKVVAGLVLIACLAGCESNRQINDQTIECVGITEPRDSQYNYKLSIQNTILSILFFEMIFPPVVMLLTETYCPTSKK